MGTGLFGLCDMTRLDLMRCDAVLCCAMRWAALSLHPPLVPPGPGPLKSTVPSPHTRLITRLHGPAPTCAHTWCRVHSTPRWRTLSISTSWLSTGVPHYGGGPEVHPRPIPIPIQPRRHTHARIGRDGLSSGRNAKNDVGSHGLIPDRAVCGPCTKVLSVLSVLAGSRNGTCAPFAVPGSVSSAARHGELQRVRCIIAYHSMLLLNPPVSKHSPVGPRKNTRVTSD